MRSVTITDTDTDGGWQVGIVSDIGGADNIRDIVLDGISFTGSGPAVRLNLHQVADYRCQPCASLLDRRVYETSAFTMRKGIDQVVLVGPGGSVVLPTASLNVNRYTVKNVDASGKTVSTTGGETVDGSASVSVAAGATVDILSDNTNWFVLYP